jgi:uncharacterized protein YpmS
MNLGFMGPSGDSSVKGYWKWQFICTLVNVTMIFLYFAAAALGWSIFS